MILRNYFALLLFFVFGLAACEQRATFPYLPPGFYTGNFSCKTKKEIIADNIQFSLQRSGVSEMRIQPFLVGEVAKEFQRTDLSPDSFGQVSLKLAARDLSFVTKKGLHSLRGAVFYLNEQCGEWQLRPAPILKENSSALLSANFMELRSWMRKRAELLKLQEQLAKLEAGKTLRQGSFEKLNGALQNQDNLIARSKSKRQELADKINQVSEQRRRVTQQARDAIARLNLLARTSQQGQIVDLNRRISRRENRYFTAEWGIVVDEFDKQVAEELKVPVDQIPVLSRRAEEVEKLRLTLAQERKKVDELESVAIRHRNPEPQIESPVRVIRRPPPSNPPEEKPEKSWWNVF